MTTGVNPPLVVLVHSHGPHVQALTMALAEAGALGALGERVSILTLDPPGDADEGWALEQLRALLQEVGGDTPAPRLAVADLQWEVTYDGVALALTSSQFRLMRALLGACGKTVPVRVLAAALFRSTYHDRDRVAAHVKRLRRRLVEQGVDDYRLEAVRGVGYRLVTGMAPGGLTPRPLPAPVAAPVTAGRLG